HVPGDGGPRLGPVLRRGGLGVRGPPGRTRRGVGGLLPHEAPVHAADRGRHVRDPAHLRPLLHHRPAPRAPVARLPRPEDHDRRARRCPARGRARVAPRHPLARGRARRARDRRSHLRELRGADRGSGLRQGLSMLPIAKLEAVTRRFQELEHMLCSPAVLSDPNKLQKLNKERTDLEPVVAAFARLRDVGKKIADDRDLLDDPELGELARLELPDLETEQARLEADLQVLLLPKDPNDERNTIVEIRSGEGGEEAALFAADLFRMLVRYAESKRWKVEILNRSEASAGGIKELIALVTGQDVYSH